MSGAAMMLGQIATHVHATASVRPSMIQRADDRARELVLLVARRNGHAEPTGDDARQALEELSRVRGEVAAIAGELDRKAGR